MSATVQLQLYNGSAGAPTLTPVSAVNIRTNTSDTYAAAGTATPLVIPASGTNYSYWIALRAVCLVTPTTAISTLTLYADGLNSAPAGVTYKAQEATSYVQATGTSGVTGLQLNTTNYPTLTGAPVDLFSFTAAAPKSIAGSLANPSTGAFGSWFVVQVEVASTAATGAAIPLESITLNWVET